MTPSITRYRNQPAEITLTLTEFDWLRIRASLLSSASDLSETSNTDQEQQYFGTYKKVKNALSEFF